MLRLLTIAAAVALTAASSTVKSVQSGPYQHYPNIEGEVIFENDKVVVQKYVVQPGEWEGVHAHPGNQLYVHIRGGEWTSENAGKTETYFAEDGSVGWMDALDLSAQHQSGNTGDTPIEFLWITLKP